MLKVIDLVYYSHNDHDEPQPVLEIHAPATGFAEFIKDKVDIQFVKHLNYEGTEKINDIKYTFFKSRNRFWYIPFRTHRYIKREQPDIVIVEGLIFPLQLIILKFQLGKKVKIIAQHHGEKPFSGIKRLFQKYSDRFINAYLFTSIGNAKPWIDNNVIKDISKCREVLEGSTYFKRQDKIKSKELLSITGTNNFLWVGGLDKNKDPFTLLKAFEKYIAHNSLAKMYMIYQDELLLNEVKQIIEASETLKNSVKLVGKIEHKELAHWFSAADFYISCSHKEGSGYALLEAMACGCIPVVTDIASFKKMTSNGKVGYLYPVGNADALATILQQLSTINISAQLTAVEKYFYENCSFKNIADDLYKIFNEIT
ncbi:MAG: glycosyltransferase family 4 protein [Ferruginibacter sp.]